MTQEPSIHWTVVVNPHRAWVFERTGPTGCLSPVFSIATPDSDTGTPPPEPAFTGWATDLADELRLAHSAGHYDRLEVIAEAPLIQTVDRATRHHVDHAVEILIESADDAEVHREATRIIRKNRN